MGILDFLFKKRQNAEPQNEEPQKKEIICIDGYEIEKETGKVVKLPEGNISEYNIPLEAKSISPVRYELYHNASVIRFHPESTIILDGNFCNSPNIKQIIFPDKMDHIPVNEEAISRGLDFNIPKNVREITLFINKIPYTMEKLVLSENVKKFEISHHPYLKHLEIPGSLTNKAVPMINQCDALETLIIGEGITNKGYKLIGCNSLVNIILPNSLNAISLGKDDPRPSAGINGESVCHFHPDRKIKIVKKVNDNYFAFVVDRKEFSNFEFYNNTFHIGNETGSASISLEQLEPNFLYEVTVSNSDFKKISPLRNNQNEDVMSNMNDMSNIPISKTFEDFENSIGKNKTGI